MTASQWSIQVEASLILIDSTILIETSNYSSVGFPCNSDPTSREHLHRTRHAINARVASFHMSYYLHLPQTSPHHPPPTAFPNPLQNHHSQKRTNHPHNPNRDHRPSTCRHRRCRWRGSSNSSIGRLSWYCRNGDVYRGRTREGSWFAGDEWESGER